jgi:hypothetical protein
VKQQRDLQRRAIEQLSRAEIDKLSGFVPQLRSVRELFEWLQSLLGKGLLNNTNGFKRVEKICQDIDLHFGSPGRPRGS